MQIFIHRVNTLEKLTRLPIHYGVEIDIRGYGDELFLNHDPLRTNETYVTLESFLNTYVEMGLEGGIIFNTKEAGYEHRIITLAQRYGIKEYFLLDVEFPYLYRATRQEGVRSIAVRYSEAEPIEAVEAQIINGKPLLDWVWIDTNTRLPLDAATAKKLSVFKTCLVCPERWGRPGDIVPYATQMKKFDFTPTAVMTALEHAQTWEDLYTE